jgi:hypothetical protein
MAHSRPFSYDRRRHEHVRGRGGSMKHTSGLSITLAAIWVLSGCAILEPRAKEGAPTKVNVSEFSEGYALLYDLVSKEKQSSLLSIIKTMSKSLLERISETSKATAKELETLVRIDPTRNLKVTHLPRLEQGRARLHRHGDEQRAFAKQRRGPGVPHAECAAASNELRCASGTQFGRC